MIELFAGGFYPLMDYDIGLGKLAILRPQNK